MVLSKLRHFSASSPVREKLILLRFIIHPQMSSWQCQIINWPSNKFCVNSTCPKNRGKSLLDDAIFSPVHHGVKMEDQFSYLFLRPPKTLPQCKIVKDVLDLLSPYFVQIFQIKMLKSSYPPPTQSALLLLIRLQNKRSHSQKTPREY